MKKLLAVTAATAMMATTAFAGSHSNIKIGVILGFTGPIESLTPPMGDGAESVSYTHLTLPTILLV